MRLVARHDRASARAEMPRWHPVSISGYHIREAGSTAAQELAFTVANGFAYVELALAGRARRRRVRAAAVVLLQRAHRLLRGDRQVPRRAPHLGALDARALRRARASGRCSCASTRRPPACRSPRSSPRSTSCAPRSRRWPACSAARRACTPTRWTRRSRCPTEKAARHRAAHPAGDRARDAASPTSPTRSAARGTSRRSPTRWSARPRRSSPTSTSSATARCSTARCAAIEEGWFQGEIADCRVRARAQAQRRAGTSIVGVNRLPRGQRRAAARRSCSIGPEVEEEQRRRLEKVRAATRRGRASAGAGRADAAEPTINLMPALLDAVRVYATLGEIVDALADVFGRWVEQPGSDRSRVRHARDDDLDRIEPLLAQLRALDGLTEKSRGVFYRRSRACLHFHADGDDTYADVRFAGDEFERTRATTKAEQRALVAAVRRALDLACAPMDRELLDVARAREGLHARRRGPGAARRPASTAAASGRCSRSARTAASRRSTSARRRAPRAPCCSRSTITAARRRTRPGWEHHDPEVVDPETGRMDTLPFFRRTIEDAGLEDVVVAVVGDSPTGRPRAGRTPLGFLFIDGGHAEDVAMADYEGWSPHVAPGRRARDPRRVRGPGRRRPGAVPRVAARGRRRLRARRDDRQPPHPPPLTRPPRASDARRRTVAVRRGRGRLRGGCGSSLDLDAGLRSAPRR